MNLKNKHIVLGITGGIAAYKAPNLVRLLRSEGAQVRVVLTETAKQFVTPLSLEAVSGEPTPETAMEHIELARWADAILIAPASAHCLARLAHGFADDVLSALVLATQAPVMVAPAMNRVMWLKDVTQANVTLLTSRGMHVLPVAEGAQACGDIGPGRMLEPNDIAASVPSLFAPQLLAGKQVLITAGPTLEAIDPVRFIGNRSSGKMGYALAQVAQQMGAEVTLISGPTNIAPPIQVDTLFVNTALEMYDKVMTHIAGQDIFIATAAVSDYRVAEQADEKIKKTDDTMTLNLVKNPDILQGVATLAKRPLCIGFAAETENVLENGKQKLQAKNLDMVCVNDVSQSDIGFDSDHNQLTLITQEDILRLDKMSKIACAQEILKKVTHASKMPAADLSSL